MDSYIERDLLGTLNKHLADDRILAIRGARQTGKSTLLEIISDNLKRGGVRPEDITYITFEDPAMLDDFVRDPRALLGSYINDNSRHYFLLDEVQYDKGAGKRLKLVFDTMKSIKLIITGSSSLEISQISKFLVGRIYLYDLYTLSFGEYLRYSDERLLGIYAKNNSAVRSLLTGRTARQKISTVGLAEINKRLEEYAIYGGYPEVVKHKGKGEKVDVIKNIYITYIGKDVTSLLGITDSASFRKVLALLSFQIGAMVNYDELGASSQTYYKQLIGYISAMEETYIIRTIRPFHKNLRTELRKNPKIYVLDNGLRNYIANNFNSLDAREDTGHLIENLAFTQLYRMVEPNQQLHFWRTLAKAEVDFVFVSGAAVIPVEIKFSSFKKPQLSRGMRSFIDTYRPRVAIVATEDFVGHMTLGKTSISFIPVAFL